MTRKPRRARSARPSPAAGPGPEVRGPLPGPRARALLERDRAVMSPYNRPFYYPAVVESAAGCIVTDIDGNRFIDLNSGLGVMNVGHAHPKVIAAIRDQVERLQHYSYTDFHYRYAVDLAERLARLTPGKFAKKVFFGGSGAESIEAALKLTRWHTRRPQFIAFLGAFHGRTMGALSLTASSPVQKRRFFPTMPGVVHVPYGNCYRCPFRLTSASVSSPAQTRSTRSASPGCHPKVVSYTQSVRPIQVSAFSLASRYGSGIRPAASRSVCTQPGTVAGTARWAISGGTCGPGTARSTQPSYSACLLTISPRLP